MNRNYVILFVLFIAFGNMQAQSRRDLLEEVERLRTALDTTTTQLADVRKKSSLSSAKAESYESQVLELQNANATLLKSLNNFAQVSNKNSENVNRALAQLEEKESQLKLINDGISINDSTAVVLLTRAKQVLGDDAKIKVDGGTVIISNSLTTVFGNDTGNTISETGITWLEKVANVLKANPKMGITVEGLSMTGEFHVSNQQAAAVSSALLQQFKIAPKRIVSKAKDGGFKEGISLKLHPDYERFYTALRDQIKNGN